MRFFLDESGNWSGGGKAFLSNARYARSLHNVLRGDPARDVPFIPRNVPASYFQRHYVLAPQNAWPYTPIRTGWAGTRHLALKAASNYFGRQAMATMRISGAIPSFTTVTSPVIHNVLDPAFDQAVQASLEIRMEQAAGSILSVGSLTPYRNFSRLLKAYANYKDSGGGRSLTLIGPSVGTLGKLPSGVQVYNGLSRAECLAAIRRAFAVVLPSLIEASPLTALEAVALNPRVCLSRIVGHCEIVDAAGIPDSEVRFFDPLSVSEMTRVLIDLEHGSFREEPLHRLLGDAEFRWEQRRRWADSLCQWLESIDDLNGTD